MPGTGIYSLVSGYTFTECLPMTWNNLISGAARPNALLKLTYFVRYIAKGDHFYMGKSALSDFFTKGEQPFFTFLLSPLIGKPSLNRAYS